MNTINLIKESIKVTTRLNLTPYANEAVKDIRRLSAIRNISNGFNYVIKKKRKKKVLKRGIGK